MKKILDYISKNLADPITIDELAQYMGMSLSTLSRFLKKNTNRNFTDFLQEYRINSVVRELNNNEKECIMDIASRCGLSANPIFTKYLRNSKVLPHRNTVRTTNECELSYKQISGYNYRSLICCYSNLKTSFIPLTE